MVKSAIVTAGLTCPPGNVQGGGDDDCDDKFVGHGFPSKVLAPGSYICNRGSGDDNDKQESPHEFTKNGVELWHVSRFL